MPSSKATAKGGKEERHPKKKEDALSRLGFSIISGYPKPNPNILLYTPPPSDARVPSLPQSQSHPKLVLLATWLGGATPSRIATYARTYQSLYPTSSILIIRSEWADMTTKPNATLQKEFVPARDHILSLLPLKDLLPTTTKVTSIPGQGKEEEQEEWKEEGENGKALFHLFSHGGVNTAIHLIHSLRSSHPSFSLPLLGLILDSTPGTSSPPKAYLAFSYSLPQTQPLNLLAKIAIVPPLLLTTTLQHHGFMTSPEDLRRDLNNFEIFGREVPRLYLYSRKDRVVNAGDVEAHAEELRKKGGFVWGEVVWEDAEHCALVRKGGGMRYWAAVREFVKGGGVARYTGGQEDEDGARRDGSRALAKL